MAKVLVPLAPGFEEIEAITVIDILRRATVTVIVAGTVDGPITASRGTRHLADVSLDDVVVDELDMLILPGGQPGTDNLAADPRIRRIIEHLHQRRRPLAAICAAPAVLAACGVLESRQATSHPVARDLVASRAGAYREERVEVDGGVITSRAAGTAMEFAFALVEQLCGPEEVAKVNRGVLARLAG